MTSMEVFRTVKDSGTCHLVRPRKDAPGQYDARPFGQGSKRGWFYVDLFTASAVCAVHDALNDKNKAKLEALAIPKAAHVAFRLVR